MKGILLAAAAAAAAAAFATAPSLANAAENSAPMVDVAHAKIEGRRITGITTRINKPGYLVIHDKAAGNPPESLGHIALETGKTRGVSIEADSPLDPGNDISLMLHYETNGNHTYDFGPGNTDVDTPVKVGNKVISVPLQKNSM